VDQARLAVLRAEVEKQLEAIASIYHRIEKRKRRTSQAYLESLGYQLHNLYCAFEDLFKIVASTFENEVTNRTHYHTELLRRMTMAIEGVRPALLSEETYRLLDNLRSFRHLFRHAYAYELDPRKLKLVLESAMQLKTRYLKEVHGFLNSLQVTR